MSSDQVWNILTYVIVLAIIFMLVRPGSPSVDVIKQTGDFLSSLVKTTTGYQTSELKE
jgi:hypothetical protein